MSIVVYRGIILIASLPVIFILHAALLNSLANIFLLAQANI